MADIPELTLDQVEARLGQQDFFVFDTNGPGRWRRSHVPTAKNLNPYTFAASELPPEKAVALVFYCAGPG